METKAYSFEALFPIRKTIKKGNGSQPMKNEVKESLQQTDKEKLNNQLSEITAIANQLLSENITIGKIQQCLTDLKIKSIAAHEHSKDARARTEVNRVELQNIINTLLTESSNSEYDIKHLHRLLKVGADLTSNPENYNSYNKSLKEYLAEPIPEGIPFPYCNTDRIKLRAGVPTIIGAYAGVGKSTVMINMAMFYHNYFKKANQNKIQWIFTLEMSGSDIAISLVQWHLQNTGKSKNIDENDPSNPSNIYNIKTNHKEYNDYLDELESSGRLVIKTKENSNKGNYTIDEIEAQVEYAAAMGSCPTIVYIDYFTIIELYNSNKNDDAVRTFYMEIMQRLTALCKKYKIFMILLAQANRGGHDLTKIEMGYYLEAPKMKTLQETSSLEQSAGFVCMVGRIFVNKKDERDILEFKIEKNRFGATSRKPYYYKLHKQTKYIEEFVTESIEFKEVK